MGLTLLLLAFASAGAAGQQERRFWYVAVPGLDIETTERGTTGILVFDIDAGHKFVRRISPWPRTAPLDEHVRGIAADVKTRRLYLSTVGRIAAVDLLTERVVWEKTYDGHCCDRLAVSPDGGTIYAPAFGRPKWYVVRARDGELITTIGVTGFPRQTIYSRDGRRAYLAAWESPVITVVEAASHKVVKEIGPFGGFVCPFTITARDAFAFATVDGLVGFEVGDVSTGLILDRVVVEGSDIEAAAKYECPSHGIALTPDERELWVANGVDNRLHVFNATEYPPVAARTIDLLSQPRWISFGIDGRYAYASSGDVIDRASAKIIATLKDEHGAVVRSEKMLEIDFSGDQPIRAGRQ